MASIIDEAGQQATPEGEIVLTPEQRSRARDLILIRLRGTRLTWDDIGRILNMSASRARHRYAAIPPDVRDYYGSLQLG